MTYVVCRPCIGTKDRSCVEVCPVDCFYDIRDTGLNEQHSIGAATEGDVGMLMIHPDECINCGARETECPVEAIYEDTAVPEEWRSFVELNEKATTALGDDALDELRCTSKLS